MAETTSPSGKAGNGAEVAVLVYRYRVKNLNGELNRMARSVNFAWNFCNDTQRHALRWGRRWPSRFDLTGLVSGSSKELGVSADSLSAVCLKYDRARRASGKQLLRYRGRKSLGWIPLRDDAVAVIGEDFKYYGKTFRVFNPRPLPPGAEIMGGGSFAQDAERKWYLNICFRVPVRRREGAENAVGIDLGLKALATLSNGISLTQPQFYRRMEHRVARATRANKKRQVRRLGAKCANSRKDYIHKATTKLAADYSYIAIGSVPITSLGRTKMAKSVYDAGWAIFNTLLRYKTIASGGTYVEVAERFTTQLCSECGSLPASRPQGIAGLEKRQWTCSDCGAHHDRDVNAARNILARSRHGSLVEGAAKSRRCRKEMRSAPSDEAGGPL